MSVDFNNFPGKFTRLILSGGGPRGLAILGALHYIQENGGLDNIEEYWGTSMGAIIGLLLLIGYTPFEAFHQFFMLDHFADPAALDIQTILEETAFCPIEFFGSKVQHFIENKLGKGADPTFLDLYIQFGKKIHIMGANTDTMRGECFNVDTHPKMKIIDAIEISCDLPYIFTKKKYNGSTYVNGGFINNYPVNIADDDLNYCLGVCVFGNMREKGGDYIGWIYRLLYMPIMELHRERVSRLSDKVTNIELTINGVGMIEMAPDRKTRINVFSTGYKQAKIILLDTENQYMTRNMRYKYTIEEAAENPDFGKGSWDLEWDWPKDDWEQILDSP